MGLASNKAANKIPSLRSSKSSVSSTFQKNVETMDNIKIKRQMASMQKARARGDNSALMKSVRKSGMQGTVKTIDKQPLVRYSSAKVFAENV